MQQALARPALDDLRSEDLAEPLHLLQKRLQQGSIVSVVVAVVALLIAVVALVVAIAQLSPFVRRVKARGVRPGRTAAG